MFADHYRRSALSFVFVNTPGVSPATYPIMRLTCTAWTHSRCSPLWCCSTLSTQVWSCQARSAICQGGRRGKGVQEWRKRLLSLVRSHQRCQYRIGDLGHCITVVRCRTVVYYITRSVKTRRLLLRISFDEGFMLWFPPQNLRLKLNRQLS